MVYKVRRTGGGSAEEILADLARVAKLTGNPAVTQDKYQREGEFSVSWVVKTFGSWNAALSKAGCSISHSRWSADDCLIGIKAVWDTLGHQPSYSEYQDLAPRLGHPCISTVESHIGSWSAALIAFEKSAQTLDKAHGEDAAQEHGLQGGCAQRRRRSHECGEPSGFEKMIYCPINEMGVLALFGTLAYELGIVIESVGSAYPDCIGRRRDQRTGRLVQVRIELEFRSSNFERHGHPEDGCELLVCWEHDWKSCPPNIEVISLMDVLKSRSQSAE